MKIAKFPVERVEQEIRTSAGRNHRDRIQLEMLKLEKSYFNGHSIRKFNGDHLNLSHFLVELNKKSFQQYLLMKILTVVRTNKI